jgi:hypothetical protein
VVELCEKKIKPCKCFQIYVWRQSIVQVGVMKGEEICEERIKIVHSFTYAWIRIEIDMLIGEQNGTLE